jgi:hypothetical protein
VTTPRPSPSLATLYAAAVLAGLSAAWSLWMFAHSLDQFAIMPYASGYGPARLTVVSVLDDRQGPLVEGTIDESNEAIRVADLGIAVAPGELTPGRTLDVLYNPDAPRMSLNHRELRVRAYERDFARVQRERAVRLALIAYGPVGVFLLATIACGRARRRPLRGPLTAPILLVGFQVTLAALFAAVVMIDTMQSRGWSAPAWFDGLMRASGRPASARPSSPFSSPAPCSSGPGFAAGDSGGSPAPRPRWACPSLLLPIGPPCSRPSSSSRTEASSRTGCAGITPACPSAWWTTRTPPARAMAGANRRSRGSGLEPGTVRR